MIQNLKGFRDFLPKTALKRQWLKEKIIEVFELWGYDPMETPTLEPLELFAGQIGEDEKLFFKFKDNGGRDVALRYDQTVPACRVVGQYNSTLISPFKRYQIQPAFRAENPQKGRYREFLQCDADIFGIDSPFADAEVIALSLDIYRRLGFTNAKALINDRSLLRDFPYEAIVAIDKLKKIGEKGVIADMEKKGITNEKAMEYLKIIPKLKPNETITIILDYLKNNGFSEDWYEFDPTIARSFSYATGPIWEIVIPGFNGGSVLGGERFDKLIEQVAGIDIPGTGFGLGFDRTLEAIEQFGLLPDIKTKTQALITIFDINLASKSTELAMKFRNNNINTELYANPKAKLDKQLKYADQKNIPYIIILGPDELKNNTITLKNLKTREQETSSIEDIIIKLKA
ncbi:histidine--tRNA ligase [Candidatus Levyibacteriota bacterium]|nr:histidine--tRNA ligase [Candidatus Levybacteria bacterium]MSU25978.1 histidine--tRNA ligase [Candidatus Levybacteria bacterium]GDX62080.1 histidine--tRNA ligase [Candidatus Levybacteria bacterium]